MEEAGHKGPVSEGCIMSLTPSGLFPPPRVTEVDSLSSTLVGHDALPSQAQKGWDQPPRLKSLFCSCFLELGVGLGLHTCYSSQVFYHGARPLLSFRWYVVFCQSEQRLPNTSCTSVAPPKCIRCLFSVVPFPMKLPNKLSLSKNSILLII